MAVTITHNHVSAIPNDPTKDVSSDRWNEAHSVTGLGTAAEADSADFATAAQGALADTALQPADVGTAAAKNTGTSGANVPLLDGANTWSAAQTFAIGTITTSQPFTISQTWNAAGVTFEGWLLDITSTASAAASLAMNVMVGGSSIFSIQKDGLTNIASTGGTGPTITLAGETTTGFGRQQANGWAYYRLGTRLIGMGLGSSNISLNGASILGWASGAPGGAQQVGVGRNASGIAEINDGGTLGNFRDLKLRNLIPGATLATNMTDGFYNLAGAAGAPSGTPANTTGFPCYWDSTNLKLYVYTGGAWKASAAFT